jgi:poly-gamma-glutamate synthesis protein (capsule biosynthesis protein)
VIVSLHWGTEYQSSANSHQVTLAHRLVDAGADLVLGHHPHVIQAMEVYNDRLIVYSLGDFIWDRHSTRATGEAYVLQVSIPLDGPPWGTMTPVYLSNSTGVPAVVTGSEAAAILDRLTRLSAARGLQLNREGDIATFGTPPGGATTTTYAPTTTTSGSTTTTSGSATSTSTH